MCSQYPDIKDKGTTGTIMKQVMNMVLGMLMWAFAEGLSLAKRAIDALLHVLDLGK